MSIETELARVAEGYRLEGYAVTLRPEGAQLPAFPAAFHPDMIATKGNANVLVQVKESREDLQQDPDVSRMAEVINAQPGWRFDLVVLNGHAESEKVARDAE